MRFPGGFGEFVLCIFDATGTVFIMQHYSEKQIKLLHHEFNMIKKYIDKLSFYDRHFGIIPFTFPDFDPLLSIFFDDDKTNILIGIFKQERNNPALTEKLFSYKKDYRFSIRPANSNNSLYSNYILSRFLSEARRPESFFHDPKEGSTGEPHNPKGSLVKANDLLNSIEYQLLHEYDKSLKLHFMTVFYKGLYDAFISRIVLPDKKRKFIELYLYALGILYGQYLCALRKQKTIHAGLGGFISVNGRL